jgi:hypothetical protein
MTVPAIIMWFRIRRSMYYHLIKSIEYNMLCPLQYIFFWRTMPEDAPPHVTNLPGVCASLQLHVETSIYAENTRRAQRDQWVFAQIH